MEAERKLEKLRRYMGEHQIPAVVIRKQPNFSWITGGGRGFIGLASENAYGSLVITPERAVLVSNNIESCRLMGEELPKDVFTYEEIAWQEDAGIPGAIEKLCPKGFRDDGDLNGFFTGERTCLCAEEVERFRELGREVDQSLWEAVRNVKAGLSEFEMAGKLSEALWSHGLEPITLLVAADDRSRRVRHYVPTTAKAEKGMIFSVCARRGGLVASATRSIAFQPGFARDYERLLEVEYTAISETVSGAIAGQVFDKITGAYERIGMPGEWKRHHQGGLTGYLPREIRVDSQCGHEVRIGEVYAWNPSCEGAKCEDSVLVTDSGPEILTAGGGWPTITVHGLNRPAVLGLYE